MSKDEIETLRAFYDAYYGYFGVDALFDPSDIDAKDRATLEGIRAASGMSAFGQDPKGLEAKPASPTAEGGDAQR